ncbi:MAG: sigma-54-dependent Fis family transcriptional regulator [Desulfuromonadales bacterium]|nr:sigma-54-dependent Fis family transcriptional regulator [Desulfuromonadales bacterium]
MTQPLVLIIDDDESLRRVMELSLLGAGYSVATAENGRQGIELFEKLGPDIVITDVQMPELSGYEVLEHIKQNSPATLVVVVTAFGSIDKAVKAMKMGAYDYITKPFSRDVLRLVLKKALEYRSRQTADGQIRPTIGNDSPVIGQHPQIKKLLEMTARVADTDATVLLTGESGTGKEVFAQEIHRRSRRNQAPFVAVNCAAIPAELLESELFGHVKGAFTGAIRDHEGKFQQARGGTIFLDEIGEMPLPLQPKLLRVLQEKQVEPVGGTTQNVAVRVVAATNRDLEQALREQTFREDLYYRLAVVTLDLPSLRERQEDIPLFVQFFLEKFGVPDVTLSDEVLNLLTAYPWPGNIRELANAIERMTILRTDDRLTIEDLPAKILQNRTEVPGTTINLPHEGYSLRELEKQAVIDALQKNNWNQSRAAAFLRIPRHTLLYRMEKYDIPRKKPGSDQTS